MSSRYQWIVAASCVGVAVPAFGQWVNYVDETSTRLISAPGLGATDTEEKDYAIGDIDNDGDQDIIVVRKTPFTSTGKRANVLFMNEGIAEGHSVNGVLVDRTADFAIASDIPGDLGFQTPTNDRDVQMVDVNNDGWLDVVTATTLTDNQAKHLSHPRVYINLGELAGVWQGIEYQDARIPQMHATAGPRFCSVAAGDLTGDDRPDLYFGDYDSGGGQIHDYNNRLLINDGNGFFTDQTTNRLTTEMALSAFGAASVIADINNDGANDVVKQTSLASPTHIAVTYNGIGAGEGEFDDFGSYDTVYAVSPYFVSAGDLNGDGLLDLVITDDGNDVYMLHQGNGGNGEANWQQFSFGSPSAGFGGDSVIADLNNDGHNDVLITDVDVDIAGCNRRMHIYRNLGDTPNVSLQEQGQIIPNADLNGTHDVAVVDLNNDGWLDLVVGRCSGTQVYMNQPPEGMLYTYPTGLPPFATPGQPTNIEVLIAATGTGELEPDTGMLTYSIDGGASSTVPMTLVSSSAQGDLYLGTIPPAECTAALSYYFSADLTSGGTFSDPPNAPTTQYDVFAALGLEVSLRDELEGDLSGWTVVNDGSLTSGAWEAVNPNSTVSGGNLAAPEDDATNGQDNVIAFVTENGPPGGSEFANDVDGGFTYLISPVVDLLGTDATISYSRWMYSEFGLTDELRVEVSDSGGPPWIPVTSETTSHTGSQWQDSAFVVSDWIVPTAQVRVRFVVGDTDASLTEAGIDNFQVEEFICGATACLEDLDGSGDVGFSDVLQVIGVWGCTTCPNEDLNLNGTVDFADILLVIGAWGPCP